MMKSYYRYIALALSVALSCCLIACEKKKQGEVVVTEQEFVLRQDKESSYTIDARGKIKNIGEVDVKNVVVTGYCRSCDDLMIPGRWFVSRDVEKMPHQKDIISYITAGNEESFSFKEIAFYPLTADREAPELPEELEAVIESFETVEK